MSRYSSSRTITEANLANQDNTIDMIARGEGGKRASRSVPRSLKPDDKVSLGCVLGDSYCKAIRDNWRFSRPITVKDAEEFDSLVERCGNNVYVGLDKDIDDTASIAAQQELEAEFNA
jgi:hypothetical protein